MKFRVERDALADALAWVARALPTRPVVPVLSGLRLTADDGLTLSCFDYEVSATARIDADVAEPGVAIVPGRLLAEITRNLPALAVDITDDADQMDLTCGSADFTLVTLPAEDYPSLPATPPLAGSIDGGLLAAAISQVVVAASRDDTLPMLTGVCLDIDGGTLTLAATDRYRLAVRELSWEPARSGLRAAALVPARTLADAARAMTLGTPVTIAFETAEEPAAGSEPKPAEGMISFVSGGRRLTTRLIGGEFIRYRARFPAEYGCQADVPAAIFTEAVRRAALVADRASPVQLTFGPGRVTIEAHTEGRARAVESVPAEFHGDQPVISFNPHYLLDGLAAAASPDPQRHPAGAKHHAGARSSADASPKQDADAHAGASQDGETAGEGDAGQADAAGQGSGPLVDGPALLRLEFTSPAKPALITRAPSAGASHDPAEEAGPAPSAAFRYLVVPQRSVSRT